MDISVKDKVNAFKIFAGFNSNQIDKVLSLSHLTEFLKGDVLIEADSIVLDMYIILSGKLETEMQINSSETFNIETRKTGDIFGSTIFMQSRRTLLRLTAINKMLTLRIDREKLYQLLNTDNRLGYLLMQNIARILDQRLTDYCFKIRENRSA